MLKMCWKYMDDNLKKQILEMENNHLQSIYEADELLSFYVVIEDEKVKAYISFKEYDEVYDIYNLVVKKPFRNQGYGKKLINVLNEKDVYLEVAHTNHKALSLYTNQGFKKVNVHNCYYGPSIDAYVMKREKVNMNKIEPLIFNELKKYIDEDILRLDVPGHKGNYFDNDFIEYFGENIIRADVNSMSRLDNLNYAKGIIKKSQLNIAKLHGAKDARYLVNGTTIGIQIMILASVKEGDKILIPKNIHKSVQSALVLSGAIPIYLDVEYDNTLGIYTKLPLEEIKDKLSKHREVKACLLINPSYYGVSYEFENIVKFLKLNNIIVLVDEAHGGSYYFQENTISAMDVQADMSCISYHKTLGTLTQTSLLLYNSDKVDMKNVDMVFSMLTTTSPSYLFLSNLEVSIIDLFFNKKANFLKLSNELEKFKEKIKKIPNIMVVDAEYLRVDNSYIDDLRLVISVEKLSISGYETYDILRDDYNIQVELGEFNIILCIVTIFDDFERLERLCDALSSISKKYSISHQSNKPLNEILINKFEQTNFISPRNFFYSEIELLEYDKALDRIIGESLMLYPPGIPIVLQGEKVTQELLEYIGYLILQNENIYGLYDNKIRVIKS